MGLNERIWCYGNDVDDDNDNTNDDNNKSERKCIDLLNTEYKKNDCLNIANSWLFVICHSIATSDFFLFFYFYFEKYIALNSEQQANNVEHF